MNSILSDLYHGELRPNERDYPDGSDAAILLESFRQNEKWLAELLDGKAKEHLLELINIQRAGRHDGLRQLPRGLHPRRAAHHGDRRISAERIFARKSEYSLFRLTERTNWI